MVEEPTAPQPARKALNTLAAALGVAAAAGLVVVASLERAWSFIAIAAAGGVVLFCLPTGVAFTLFLLSTYLERTRWEIGFTFRLEYPFILLMALVLLLRTKGRPARVPPTYYPVLAYLALNFISTSLHSTDPAYGFRQFIVITTVTLAYFIVSEYCLRHPERLTRLFHIYLAFGVLESLYGILSFVLLQFGIENRGAYQSVYGAYYATGTMLEGNIFGGMVAMQGLFLFNLAQSPALPAGRRRWLWAGVAVHVAALVMSNTRTAWVGFMLGIALSIIMGKREEFVALVLRHWRTAVAVAAGVAIFVALASVTRVVDPAVYKSRFAGIFAPRQEKSMVARVDDIKQSIRYWRKNFLIGNGTGSYRSMLEKETGRQKGWISNQFVLSLQDTGVVGVGVLVWLLGATFLPFLPVLRSRRGSPGHPYLLGSFAALACIWICFQVTAGTWLAYFWVVFGFAAAFLEIYRDAPGRAPEADALKKLR